MGQPRKNWYIVTLADLWVEAKTVIDNVKYVSEFDFRDARHKAALQAYAKIHLKINK